MANSDKPASPADHSYVLVARDYADIAHLENPSVIERILSASRTEKVAYVSALLTSGLSKYALTGPKVAFAAMAVEALTDFGKEVSEWIKEGRIPENFSGRPSQGDEGHVPGCKPGECDRWAKHTGLPTFRYCQEALVWGVNGAEGRDRHP